MRLIIRARTRLRSGCGCGCAVALAISLGCWKRHMRSRATTTDRRGAASSRSAHAFPPLAALRSRSVSAFPVPTYASSRSSSTPLVDVRRRCRRSSHVCTAAAAQNRVRAGVARGAPAHLSSLRGSGGPGQKRTRTLARGALPRRNWLLHAWARAPVGCASLSTAKHI